MKIARDPEQLKRLIEERGLSSRQMGRVARCSHTAIYKVVRGNRLGDELARRIARALNSSVAELFVEEPATATSVRKSA